MTFKFFLSMFVFEKKKKSDYVITCDMKLKEELEGVMPFVGNPFKFPK